MNNPIRAVEIDRIVLTGLDVTPDRAERIRALMGVELQRILESGGRLEGLAGGEVRRLDAPAVHVADLRSDGRIASGLARSIAQAVRGVKGE